MNILFTILFLLIPSFLIVLLYYVKPLRAIGTVLLCYILGMIVGNSGILPDHFKGVQATIQDVSVALALPLLLFSLDVKKWTKMARSAIVGMGLAIIAIAITTFFLHIFIGSQVSNGWQLAGMATAVYTGGTPNLAAIKSALNISSNTYILFNTYDTVFSLIYIFIMVSVARVFFKKYFKLKDFKVTEEHVNADSSDLSDESIDTYVQLVKPSNFKGLVLGLFISALILGVSFVIGSLFPKDYQTTIIILSITSLGVGASFIQSIRELKYTFQLGMYIIYVFCFTVATMTNLSVLIHIDYNIFIYVFIAIFGSVIIHAGLCKVAKVDVDTMIITSVAAVCSPPFVPVVASGLKNKYILISGLIAGIIGYALGNYLGIGVALLYKMLG